MHEMGIAMQILGIVQQSLPPGEALRVKAIHLTIGKLTAIVPSSLTFCMNVVTKDTAADGAEIVFNEVPVKLMCEKCGAETEVSAPPFVCGKCGSDNVEVVAGREMVIDSIEVEEAAP
jgi:hydrogenase nickel incorporation protein HypA/HybF